MCLMFFAYTAYIFIQEDGFDNVVCEMAAILSREKWAKILTTDTP